MTTTLENSNTLPGRGARARRLLAIGLVWLTVPILVVTGLEAGLRVAGYGRNASPLRRLATDQGIVHLRNQYYYPVVAGVPTGDGWLALEFAIPELKADNSYRMFVFGGSAAFGWPHQCSFARILQLMLITRYPGVRFEVYNWAYASVNSSIMRPLARASSSLSPDAFIIYMGNNEVFGPYGLITDIATRPGRAPTIIEIRIHQWIRGLRLGQLFIQTSESFRNNHSKPSEDKQRGNAVRFDDPRLSDIAGNYRSNLCDMFRSARGAGADVFISTLGANLRHWPPSPNALWRDMPPDMRERWEALLQTGRQYETQEQWDKAVATYDEAAAINDSSALLAFRRAGCHWALGEYDTAAALYENALELDEFFFVRAKNFINETLRETVAANTDAAHLVEGQAAFAKASPHGVVGNEQFASSCHMTMEGAYVLARAYFDVMTAQLPKWVKAHENADAPLPNAEEAAYVLGMSRDMRIAALRTLIKESEAHGLDNTDFLRETLERLLAAPISVNLYERIERLGAFIAAGSEDYELARSYLACLLQAPDAVTPEVEQWIRMLATRYPFDRQIQHHVAELLLRKGHRKDAENVYRQVLALYPDDTISCVELMALLLQSDRVEELQPLTTHARRYISNRGIHHFLHGAMRLHQGDTEAAEILLKSLRENTDPRITHRILNALEMRWRAFDNASGDAANELIQRISDILAQRPDKFDALFHLAIQLIVDGRHVSRGAETAAYVVQERPYLAHAFIERLENALNAYREQNNYPAIETLCRLALALGSEDVRYRSWLEEALAAQAKPE